MGTPANWSAGEDTFIDDGTQESAGSAPPPEAVYRHAIQDSPSGVGVGLFRTRKYAIAQAQRVVTSSHVVLVGVGLGAVALAGRAPSLVRCSMPCGKATMS